MKKILFIGLLIHMFCIGNLQAQLFGGQLKSNASAYPPGTVHCNPQIRTAVVEVTSPGTGRVWMDRNLGAERVAISSTDDLAFGDLYQWGRGPDGHQCRNSGTRTTISALDQPGHDDFILVATSSTTDDWRNPQKNALWQGVSGINNPCPTGFRIPPQEELRAERLTWTDNSSVGAINSVLKLPLSGYRERTDGVVSLTAQGFPYGMLWTSSISGEDAVFFAYFSGNAFENPFVRSRGYAIRCIKN